MNRFATLCYKELLRFFKVSVQTVAAPVLTTLLYLVIFGQALEGRLEVYAGLRYTAFLAGSSSSRSRRRSGRSPLRCSGRRCSARWG